jgi:hypothetical protein
MPLVQQATEETAIAHSSNIVEETKGIADNICKIHNVLSFKTNGNPRAGAEQADNENIGKNAKPPATSSNCGSHTKKPLKRINAQKSKFSITD